MTMKLTGPRWYQCVECERGVDQDKKKGKPLGDWISAIGLNRRKEEAEENGTALNVVMMTKTECPFCKDGQETPIESVHDQLRVS